jgi:endo-1,4-beta-xylanase
LRRYKNSLPNKPPVISVVNEAYDNGDFFKDKIGEEYVDIAFQAARKAAPSAVLIYNDYANHVFPPRWDGTRYKLTKKTVDRLKSKGLIDGVGLQMHLDGSSPPSKQELIATMRSCGVPVYITEFDVNMRNVSGTAEERNRIQTEIYRDVTEAAIESGVCRGIIDFQLGDKFSFFENVTTSGGYSENADPTPFDDDLNPKPAFFAQRKAFLTASSGN